MKTPAYSEWLRFSMQLQLFALCAYFDLKRAGYRVRKRGAYRPECLVGRKWQPLRTWPSSVAYYGDCPPIEGGIPALT